MNNKIKLNSMTLNNSLTELKKRIFFVIIVVCIFRIGSFIPIPGINHTVLINFLKYQQGNLFYLFNIFSGGSLNRASIFSLGIMPYISSSIVIQLLTLLNPYFSSIKKQGERGKYKINQYIRYTTLLISFLQAVGITIFLPNLPGMEGLVINPNFYFYFTSTISIVTGTMLLMWLGELITECGIGNGVSIIVFLGIISGLPSIYNNVINDFLLHKLNFFMLFLIFILVFFTTFFVVFIERSYRKIILNYSRQDKNCNINALQSAHLPLKINVSGVMPAIFSSSIIIFISAFFSWFGLFFNFYYLVNISYYLQPGHLLYIIIYAILIIFFCFFYSKLAFNSRETAENLKKSGAFIPGIRPGQQTDKYIENIIYKLNFIGSFYILLICLIPEFIKISSCFSFYFGGTSLLIVVLVIIDFITQIQTLIMSNQYNSILKKNII